MKSTALPATPSPRRSAAIGSHSAMLDGEIVSFDEQG